MNKAYNPPPPHARTAAHRYLYMPLPQWPSRCTHCMGLRRARAAAGLGGECLLVLPSPTASRRAHTWAQQRGGVLTLAAHHGRGQQRHTAVPRGCVGQSSSPGARQQRRVRQGRAEAQALRDGRGGKSDGRGALRRGDLASTQVHRDAPTGFQFGRPAVGGVAPTRVPPTQGVPTQGVRTRAARQPIGEERRRSCCQLAAALATGIGTGTRPGPGPIDAAIASTLRRL